MKKGLTISIIIAVILAGLFFWVKNSYNSLVYGQEQVSAAWAQVEKRRNDLIPNLVATVKGYAEHESETLEGVIAARAKATQVTVNPDQLSEDEIAEFQAAQGELGSALGRLMMITENYPDLKANSNFADLQAQLEGTENRIATERKKYNDTARAYNVSVRSFPANIIASIFNFETKGYFKAADGADTAPVVEF